MHGWSHVLFFGGFSAFPQSFVYTHHSSSSRQGPESWIESSSLFCSLKMASDCYRVRTFKWLKYNFQVVWTLKNYHSKAPYVRYCIRAYLQCWKKAASSLTSSFFLLWINLMYKFPPSWFSKVLWTFTHQSIKEYKINPSVTISHVVLCSLLQKDMNTKIKFNISGTVCNKYCITSNKKWHFYYSLTFNN